MADNSLVLRGVVLENSSGRAAAGVAVLVVDRVDGDPAVMLTATTDAAGAFAVSTSVDDLLHLFRATPSDATVDRRRPSLHFLAIRSGAIVGRAAASFTLAQLLAGLAEVTLRVDAAPARAGCDYAVRGRVVFPDGTGRPGTRVELVRHGLRTEAVLATVTSDPTGAFEIRYHTDAPCDPAAPRLTLSVRALESTGAVLARSPRSCDAPAELDVTLVVGDVPLRGPATVTAAERAVAGRLDGIALDDLRLDDVEQLACATGESARTLAWLARSAALAQRTGLPREVFFALAHAGVPATLGAVASLPSPQVRAALLRAAEENVVPPWSAGAVDAAVAGLAALAIDTTYRADRPRESLLGRLFENAGVTLMLPRQFVEGYLERRGTVEEFWADFRAAHGDAAVDAVQFTLHAAVLTGNHVALVAALQADRREGRLPSLRAAARRTAAQWATILRAGGTAIGTPAGFPGANEAERVELYATTLERAFEHAFPTEVTAFVLAAAGGPAQVSAFVDRNPSFDFEDANIATVLASGAVLPPGSDANLARDLRAAQRLHTLVPPLGRRSTLPALRSIGVHSARQVHNLGLGGLAHRLPQLDRAVLAQIHERASLLTAKATTLYMRYGAPAQAFGPMVIANVIPPQLPTVEGLLGRMDFCACTSCRSIYSPAAYLTDLLRFLEDRGLLPTLTARRPDLVRIRLGCANTNTVLPSIDLAIEILENLVVPGSPDRQTTWTSAELRDHPEHLNTNAYRDLAEATYPWALPFDLPRVEARTYLEHMGVSLAELRDATGRHLESERFPRAVERLRLTTLQAALITGTHDFANAGDAWGMPQANWADTLRGDVRTTLRRAAATYEDLLDLAHTSYAGGFAVAFPEDAPCDLARASFTDLSETDLSRIPRLMRLRAALGLSIPEVDAMVRALGSPGANRLDAACLQRTAADQQLAERFPHVPLFTRLSWWGRIDTRLGRSGEPSPYDVLFLDRTLAPDNVEFGLRPDRVELAATPPLSATHRSVIQAALSISEGELQALLAATAASSGTLNRHTLSRLARRASLAAALELRVADFLAITALSGAQPFADGDPNAAPDVDVTARFVAIVDQIRASGFSVAELDYLLRGVVGGVGMTDLAVATRFVELIRGLQQIRQDTTRDTDTSRTDRDRLIAALPKVIDPDVVDAAVALVTDRAPAAASVIAQLARFLTESALVTLQNAGDPRTNGERASDTLDALLVHLRRVASSDLVVQKLSDTVEIEPALGGLLLRRNSPGTTPLDLFLDSDFAGFVDFTVDGPAIATDGFPPANWSKVLPHATALRRLHAAAMLVRKFGLTQPEVELLLARADEIGWLDLLAFPEAPLAGPAPTFDAWFALARVIAARNRAFVDRPAALLAVLNSPAGPLNEATRATLTAASGWQRDDVDFVLDMILGVDGAGLRDADRFEQLVHVFDVLGRLGVSASRLPAWTTATTPASIAQAIKNTARSRIDAQAWPEVAGPLRDQLRVQQRDALVAWALHHFGFDDADDLLGRLFIDVQGEPCLRTSRIKQALASVQMFVQRVLLDLEGNLSLSADSVREWSWMSRYRVWEANRKVFLYPENYLEPALRSDVTPQFRAFIDAVGSSDGEPARLEAAYEQYLTGLDEVAHLSVCGVYRERVKDNTTHQVVVDNLHVVARSAGEPRRFYYRKQVDGAYWTAWEEIPGKIEYDDPTPFVWNGRLMLFWLLLQEVANGPAPGESIPLGPDAPPPKFEARLGWMEHRDGKWTRTTISEATLQLEASANLADNEHVEERHDIGFDVRVNATVLAIQPIMRLTRGPKRVLDGATSDAFIIHNSRQITLGKSSVSGRYFNNLDLTWPGITEPFYQTFRALTSNTDTIYFSYRKPGAPGWPNVQLPFRLETDCRLSAPRYAKTVGRPAEFVCEDPFFLQDLRRVYVVEPRDIYSAGSGAQVNPNFAGPDQAQQVNVGMYAPSQTFVASDAPQPSGTGAIMNLPIDAGLDAQPLLPSQPTWLGKGFDFSCFYHPYARSLMAMLQERGLASFLSPPSQGRWSNFRRQAIQHTVFGPDHYDPSPAVDASETVEDIDFDPWGAYSVYNWELFFHAPMLVAQQLVTSGRFEDARRWLHAVFDPHDASSAPTPARYWQVKPFFEASVPANIADEVELLSYTGSDLARKRRRKALERQIDTWRKNPFDPHLIARLRPAAYQRYTVMQYLDTLVAWGDALFRQDTIESINEATQLYILAAQLLGPRPEQIERRASPDASYADLAPLLDDLSNAIYELENVAPGSKHATFDLTPDLALLAAHVGSQAFAIPLHPPMEMAEFDPAGAPEMATLHLPPPLGSGTFTAAPTVPAQGPSLYFCIPPNEKLLGYWDTVADRLFKIRHCLNFEGIARALPLFEPPIDPALLVRARAAGLDIASALSALSAPLPQHRFRTVHAVAKDLCADVRGLGQALAQALERRDAETLAELRAGHEHRLLESVRAVREQQIDEARANRESLEQARLVAKQRLAFVAARKRRIAEERSQPSSLSSAKFDLEESRRLDDVASVMGLIPDLQFGTSGVASPVITATFGGSTYAAVYGAIARHNASKGQGRQLDASIAGIQAGFTRRDEEWDQEAALAQLELERIDKELVALDIRIALAEKELANHDQQTRNAEDVAAFLRDRFTNADLYGHMASEIQRVYFSAYRLAFDLAKQAERAYQYELAAPDATFVEFGYWDNQRRGLLAGDKLMHDLRRMEVAHLEHNRRELELSKAVSLALVDPIALELLRDTGSCFFSVPEVLFDLDHPGHYLRRIKSVSVTLPLVEGAHGNVTGTLTLVGSRVRRGPNLTEAPVDDPTADLQQIGLSTGQDDAGLFERSFGDERRLPFEGRGAVSSWRLELPSNFRQFDYRSISDVVLRIAYTARGGGETLRTAVVAQINDALTAATQTVGTGQLRYLSLGAHFTEAWAAFVAEGGSARMLEFELRPEHFPVLLTAGNLRIVRAWLVTHFTGAAQNLAFTASAATSGAASVERLVDVNASLPASAPQPQAVHIRHGAIPFGDNVQATTGVWRISTTALPDASVLRALGLLLQYTVAP